MRFSIIIPVYNVENYLEECLDSVLMQSYDDYEIICINDASTDDSFNILRRYEKINKNLVVLNNEINKGLSYSRNKGMSVAKGEYIFFIDSDDYISNNALCELDAALQNNVIDILNFNYIVKKEGIWSNERVHLSENKYKDDLEIISGQEWIIEADKNDSLSMVAWNKVYRRQFLLDNKILFYEGILHEDALFFIESFFKANKTITISNSIYIYRCRDGSIMTQISEKKLDSFVIILNELLSIWKNNQLDKEMHDFFGKYLKKIYSKIEMLMMYYPQYEKLKLGKPEDQFLFQMIRDARGVSLFSEKYLSKCEIDRIKGYEKIIIYGAGRVAAETIKILEKNSIKIFSVAVSNKQTNPDKFGNYEVLEIVELINYKREGLVIVAVINENQEPIRRKLDELKFENVLCVNTDK